jgi:glutaredoxin
MTAVVWSKEHCPQCDKAKQLLTAKGITYEERVVGKGYQREDLLAAVPTAKSVPQVFLDGNLVGGYMELQQKLN